MSTETHRRRSWSQLSGNFTLQMLCGFAIFVLLHLVTEYYGIFGNPFRREWELCLQYLAAGTLYGGQPFCMQTPLFFLSMAGLHALAPYPNFLPVLPYLSILASGAALLIFANFLKRQTGHEHFWVMLLPYVFLIHVQLDLGSALALPFFAVALHTLIRNQPKRWHAGIALALAVLLKASFLLPMVILITMHGWQTYRRQHRAWMRVVLSMLPPLLVPLALLIALSWIAFPNLPYYTLLWSGKVTSHTLIDGIVQVFWTNIWTLNFFNFPLYVMLSAAIALAAWKPRPLSIGGAMSLTAMTVAANMHMEGGFIRFLAPTYLLVIAAWCTTFPLRTLRRIALFTTLAMLLALPTLVVWGLQMQRNEIQRITDAPLAFIPEQHGPILAEGESIAQYRDFLDPYYQHSLDQLEVLITPYQIDLAHVPGLVHYGMVNISQWTNVIVTPNRKHFYLPGTAREHNVEILTRMGNRTYDLIIIGPPSWEFSWAYAWIAREPNGDSLALSDYCYVQVPHLMYFDAGNSAKVQFLLFRNSSHCAALRQAMAEYYVAHFAEICRADRSLSDLIYNTVLPENAIYTNGTCENPGNFVERYQLVRKLDTYPWPEAMPYPIP